MLIAICDDEKSEREQVGGILVQKMKKRGEPLQIAYFEQGEDLIEQYESEDQYPGYDLIFMDIYLQRLSGMEIIRRLRKHDRNVAVIFMSSSPDYAIESYDVWADGYLLKPIVRDKVENVLNRFMEYRYPKNKKSLLMVNGSSSRRISYDDIMYIVNMDYITRADTDFTMENGDRLPIKVRERKRIREKYFAYVLERGWDDM